MRRDKRVIVERGEANHLPGESSKRIQADNASIHVFLGELNPYQPTVSNIPFKNVKLEFSFVLGWRPPKIGLGLVSSVKYFTWPSNQKENKFKLTRTSLICFKRSKRNISTLYSFKKAWF